jgi:hypothetical protein
MHELQLIRELLIIAILSAVMGVMLAATFAPAKFGQWLQKIDEARYLYLDCDCTELVE